MIIQKVVFNADALSIYITTQDFYGAPVTSQPLPDCSDKPQNDLGILWARHPDLYRAF